MKREDLLWSSFHLGVPHSYSPITIRTGKALTTAQPAHRGQDLRGERVRVGEVSVCLGVGGGGECLGGGEYVCVGGGQ